MRCKRCPCVNSYWTPQTNGHYEYRVDCIECGSYIKWGSEAQCKSDLAAFPGSRRAVASAELSEEDLSALFE